MAGRPPFEFPPGSDVRVRNAAIGGGTNADIAAVFGCGARTLVRHFGSVLVKARAARRMTIAGAQLKYALKGSAAMLIWLGKQPKDKGGLDQRDLLTFGGVDVSAMTDEELEKLAKGSLKPRKGAQPTAAGPRLVRSGSDG